MNTTTFCEDCKKQFTTVTHFKRHLLSNSHKLRTSTEKNNLVLCSCSKSFTTRSALYRHRKNCSVYINTKNTTQSAPTEQIIHNQVLKKENQEMREEIDELRKQFEMLLGKSTKNTTNNDNSQNKTNNVNSQNKTINDNSQNIKNMTININAFGNENLDYLTDQIIVKCVGRIYNSIPMLIEKIHFNPKHPENHNIKITNRKLPYASVMTKNKKWKTVDKHDAIETMMDKSFNMLEMSYEENKDEMSEHNQRRFEEFHTKFTNQDTKTVKNARKQVEIAILNASE